MSRLRLWRSWGLRAAAPFGRGSRERFDLELAAELEGHLALAIDDNLRAGMPAEEARRQAHLKLGGVLQTAERVRERRGLPPLENLGRDLRYGARTLLRNPVFAGVAILTLALGIGANTAIFSVVHQLLLRPLPFPDAERLVMLWEVTPDGERQNPTSRYNFDLWQAQGTSFSEMATFVDMRLPLGGGGDFPPEEVAVQFTSPELFRVLGVKPLLGRELRPEDAGGGGGTSVAVLGHDLWRRRFGSDPKLIGQKIVLNGAPSTVVGILPPGFEWHIRSRSSTTQAPQIWLLLPHPGPGQALHGRALAVVARLRPGVSLAAAAAELQTIKARIALESAEQNKGYGAEVVPLREQLVGNLRPALLVLLGAVGLVLLIACANVANLLLARAAAREREIALRAALGAGRGRIVRQLLTESVLLSLAGSLLGLGLAWAGLRALAAITPPELASLSGLRLHLPVLAGTLALAVATGLTFGLAPALEATRPQLQAGLKEGGRGAGGQGARSRRLQGALVVAEVALSLVLLAGAGLLVRSLYRLQTIDTGFATDNVLTFVVRVPDARYQGGPKVVTFFDAALTRLRTLPGVRQAGVVNYLPLYGGLGASTSFSTVGRPEPPVGERPTVSVRVADSGYFAALKIPLLRGRSFTATETREARHVLLINRAMAEKHFAGANPLGQRLIVRMFNEPVPAEIVGVVGDVRYDNLTAAADPTVYFPLSELPYPFMTFVLRTEGDPAPLFPLARREIQALDPDLPLSDVRTMERVMADTLGRSRFSAQLLALFAALALTLAAVGLYGVMSYAVNLRTRELGLRAALGAEPSGLLALVLRQGLRLVALGIVLGLGGALALTRLLASLLYGVGATDPATFAGIALLLAGVAALACYLPARRAARMEPLEALRAE